MALPQNWEVIAAYLMTHGYTPIAAAGILGNIEQESGGDPESVGSGGGGLIGFTPLPAGYVTGNAKKDLEFQLGKVIEYNNAQGSLLVAQLNRETSPTRAAIFYQNNFERPAVGTENQANRTQSAEDTYKSLVSNQGLFGSFNPSNLFDIVYKGLTGSGFESPGTVGKDAVSNSGFITGLGGDIETFLKYGLAAGLVLVGVYFIGRRENVIPAPSTVAKTAAVVAK